MASKKKKRWLVVLAIVALLLLLGSGVTAVTLLSLPSHIEVVAPAGLGIHSDSGCSGSTLTDIEWGQMTQGTYAEKKTYIKNYEANRVVVTVSATGLPSGITLTQKGKCEPYPGECKSLTMVLTISSGATLGDANFTTVFDAVPK